ncbi:MAG TPA: PQQ-dependent sugar dehydrogenase, partial [Dongiaceae bacterium]
MRPIQRPLPVMHSSPTTGWLLIAALAVCALPAPAAAQTYPSSAGNLTLQTVTSGLDHPWSLAFLPDGRMLVTERPGRLRIVSRDGKLSPPVAGLPKISASGQGGLLDVILDRDYAQNRTIYFCYADPVSGGARTALASAKLNDEATTPRLSDLKVIFQQEGPASRGRHFGCRIVQARDGNLFLTQGDHGDYPDEAQKLGNHIGKIVRIRPDGSVPPDNPFVNTAGAKPEIWSYGHRNSQGAALGPDGQLWMHEHGPQGGDEVNVPRPGRNHGWPVITFGENYGGGKIGEGITAKAGM